MDGRVELDPRFLRQVILVEVGPAGQGRIARASAAVGGAGLAGEIATRYAERAGFAAITPGPIPRSEAVVAGDSAAAVLDGSRAALRAILAAARGDG